MSNPQQPELGRSRKVPHQDQDAVAAVAEGQQMPGAEGPSGPVPPENQPGHHPPEEQDKPDLDAFAERLGIVEDDEPARAQASGRSSDTSSGSTSAPASRRTGGAAALGGVVALVVALLALKLLRRRSRGR